MSEIFKHITFTSNRTPTPTPIAQDEDGAFVGLTGFHYYELFARGLAVNFPASWDDITSLLHSLGVGEETEPSTGT